MKFNSFFSFYFSFIFLKINLLIQVNNTIDTNTESQVIKTLKDNILSRLIAKVYEVLIKIIDSDIMHLSTI